MVERGEFDTMREGIEAAGVVPVAFSVSRYLNTTDYFSWKVLQAIRLGETLSFTQEDATGSESLPEATSMTKAVPSGNRWNPSYELRTIYKGLSGGNSSKRYDAS